MIVDLTRWSHLISSAPSGSFVFRQQARALETKFDRNVKIQTRWRLALGRSKLPRYYAVVLTADGWDLAELLESAGLVRVYGTRTPLPDGPRFAHVLGAPSRVGSAGENRAARRLGKVTP